MIVVKIKSGLGNQMFQYAIGRRLSLDWNDELKFDLSWFSNIKSNETPRLLEIDKFNILLNIASNKEINQSMRGFITSSVNKFIDRLRGRLDRNYFFRFHPKLLTKKKNIYLDGYFQNYNYFDSIRDILLNEFSLKCDYSDSAKKIKKDIEFGVQSVALHIRRGDFVTTCRDWNGLCDVEYYRKGLGEIKKRYNDLRLFIFSDDIEWAKKNIKLEIPTNFVSHPSLNSVEELMLMSRCKHQIIANSTFSWWAAWLNQNSEKIVVAPARWLLAADINIDGLLPDSWIKI